MEGRILGLLLLCLMTTSISALNVNIPKDLYEFARGDNVTLPCTFTTTLKPTPNLIIITWSAQAASANAMENLILTHYSNPGTTDIASLYEGRVALDVDVQSGKANLKLSSITLIDNTLFECRVMIPGDDEGIPADTTRLVVLVAPSKPICKIQGKAEYGQNINLTCMSEEGSPPPTYKWESRDVQNIPRLADPRTTDKGGVLSLYNISKETSGYYICTSSNKIRSATCNITLAVMPPSMNLGSTSVIIGIVVGVLLLLAIVIFFCCRHHKKKKKEQEAYAMGVRQEEYDDKEEPPRNGDSRRADGQEHESRPMKPDSHDTYEERSERGYDDRRRDYDDRRRDYDDQRSDYDDRRSDYTDRRKDYDDRRKDYNDRRSDFDDRRSDYDDRRSDYSDRRDRDDRYNDKRHYDDARRYDDRRDRHSDDGRYDEPYDNRPPVPSNKPPRRDYDD